MPGAHDVFSVITGIDETVLTNARRDAWCIGHGNTCIVSGLISMMGSY